MGAAKQTAVVPSSTRTTTRAGVTRPSPTLTGAVDVPRTGHLHMGVQDVPVGEAHQEVFAGGIDRGDLGNRARARAGRAYRVAPRARRDVCPRARPGVRGGRTEDGVAFGHRSIVPHSAPGNGTPPSQSGTSVGPRRGGKTVGRAEASVWVLRGLFLIRHRPERGQPRRGRSEAGRSRPARARDAATWTSTSPSWVKSRPATPLAGHAAAHLRDGRRLLVALPAGGTNRAHRVTGSAPLASTNVCENGSSAFSTGSRARGSRRTFRSRPRPAPSSGSSTTGRPAARVGSTSRCASVPSSPIYSWKRSPSRKSSL